jgi:hypothetical protein
MQQINNRIEAKNLVYTQHMSFSNLSLSNKLIYIFYLKLY